MEHDAKVREALALLKQAGRMELLRDEALAPGRPARRSSAEVAAAVASCSPPRPVAGAQDTLDFEEEDPGEQEAARSPWEEAKAGPGAASRMASAGRVDGGGRLWTLLLVDVTVWVLRPLTPLLGRSNVRARQVYGRRVEGSLQAVWFVVVAVRMTPGGRLRGMRRSRM
ncbi:hypothetical protein NDU88_001848 [Pleurodeles waltl]|uniref:Uncharacterized protein n=1 Tax=Pleurodeles waltl TaxID=8319 RepID=A0AAV7NDP2_PLEWA|nr:hypothetical protein NDU88_001848 [Pleurodeles waltl]